MYNTTTAQLVATLTHMAAMPLSMVMTTAEEVPLAEVTASMDVH
jgi:hypothetical protein